MRMETKQQAKTVEAAVAQGAKELGVDVSAVTYVVLAEPKKGLFGIGAAPAEVLVSYEAPDQPEKVEKTEKTAGSERFEKKPPRADKPAKAEGTRRPEKPERTEKPEKAEPVAKVERPIITPVSDEDPVAIALAFVRTVIANLELTAEAVAKEGDEGEVLIDVTGDHAGVLIGHHGDTLDALQYLVNLAANKGEDEEHDYRKITVDVENYRAKREDTLRQLANRMAAKVLKYKKSITLEPMNPYERRIIHSQIQTVEGVSTSSVGSENNRRIVIYLTDKPSDLKAAERNAERRDADRNDRGGRRGDRNGRGGRSGDRGGRGGKRYDSTSDRPARAPKVIDAPAENASMEVTAEEKSNYEETGSYKKPYYIRPKSASGTTPRPTQKPVKKDSVESYYFDLENSGSGLHKEKEEPSEIAKACGIYDDPGDAE